MWQSQAGPRPKIPSLASLLSVSSAIARCRFDSSTLEAGTYEGVISSENRTLYCFQASDSLETMLIYDSRSHKLKPRHRGCTGSLCMAQVWVEHSCKGYGGGGVCGSGFCFKSAERTKSVCIRRVSIERYWGQGRRGEI